MNPFVVYRFQGSRESQIWKKKRESTLPLAWAGPKEPLHRQKINKLNRRCSLGNIKKSDISALHILSLYSETARMRHSENRCPSICHTYFYPVVLSLCGREQRPRYNRWFLHNQYCGLQWKGNVWGKGLERNG